ncbi:MAG: hypothetical protein QOK45_2578 [Mycobacterium sp.]|jgi:hypothetical protein|nr:hypothetical protein [Mycobacterium sp.]
MTEKAKTIVRRYVAVGIIAIALVAPVTVTEAHSVVLAKGQPNTPADTQGAPCPGAYYCLAPGTDPQVPFGTDPTVPMDQTPSHTAIRRSDWGLPGSEHVGFVTPVTH